MSAVDWLKEQLTGEVPQNIDPPPLFDLAVEIPKWYNNSPEWKIEAGEYPRPHRFITKSEISKLGGR